jgi:hypothetical protein
MKEHQTSRTLLKSPPELWAECSDAQSLARHLGESVGEIRITKLEPEHTVAWEGDRASGTVKLEPSGWGTRVTLTCSEPEAASAPAPEPDQAPEPDPAPVPPAPEGTSLPASEEPPAAPARGRLLQRVMRFLGPPREVVKPDAAEPQHSAAAEPAPPEPPAAESPPRESPPPKPAESPEPTDGVAGADLAAALDSLGQAHHRPFSRA